MKYDAILVLGRGISEDGALPDMAVKQVTTAVKLLAENVAPRIIICGKWSRHYLYTPIITEASAMKNLALSLGASEENIFLEEESLDTISNIYYAKKNLLQPNNWTRLLLLTLYKNDERALLTAHYVLGPSYVCDRLSVDYHFPPEKLEKIEKAETEKVRVLKDFLKDKAIAPGDHERIFQEHLGYIDSHQIESTY